MEKRNQAAEKKRSDVKETYGLIRDISDDYKMSASADYNFDPPKFSRFLDFFVDLEKSNIDKLTSSIKNEYLEGHLEETELNAKQLGKMIKGDPRLGRFLDIDFLKILFDFLANEQNPALQFHAATIIQHFVAYSTNKQVVKQFITPPIILNLVSSNDRELQLQAIKLLRTVALGIPDINLLLEEALNPVRSIIYSLLTSHSSNLKLLQISTLTLATVCQVHPMLSRLQFESTILTLQDIILHVYEENLTEVVLPHACYALAYLCDGRGEMVSKGPFFGLIIDRLIEHIDSESLINCNAGLIALGRIVRWASDYHIQIMIERGFLWSIEWMIRQDERYCVMYACWIISNITARKGNFIKDVISCTCIGSLVDVVQNFKFLEPKSEAAWAIINAIYGASDDHIELFRTSCFEALWNVPTIFSDNLDMILACLEVLAKLKAVTVSLNGRLIDYVQFRNYLVKLQGRRFQLVDDDELPKSKKICTTDIPGKYAPDMEFLIVCTSDLDSIRSAFHSSS